MFTHYLVGIPTCCLQLYVKEWLLVESMSYGWFRLLLRMLYELTSEQETQSRIACTLLCVCK